MKLRCVNADDPPCKRCAHFGEDCIVGQPTQRRLNARAKKKDDTHDPSRAREEERRIEQLENKVNSMQSTLQDILAVLQSGVPATSSQAPPNLERPFLPDAAVVPDIIGSYGERSHRPIRSQSSISAQVLLPPDETIWQAEEVISQPSSRTHSILQAMPRPAQGGAMFPFDNPAWFVQPIASGSTVSLDPTSHSQAIIDNPGLSTHVDDTHSINRAMSSDERANSQSPSDEDDGDPLAPGRIAAPLGTMADLAEVAVERANYESRARRKLGLATAPEHLSARHLEESRLTSPLPSRDRAAVASSGLTTDEVDVVDAGLVEETDARELHHLFFQGCNIFIPIFDSHSDTWESLKRRSPLLLTTIVGIGARVRDGGGPVSATQHDALTHARRLASNTLFDSTPKAETVQAMILLATYNDNGRIPASHANALAMAIGLDSHLMQLLRTGMGAGLSRDELESERHLVVGSRIILYLFQLEHQLAFGTGRPALFRKDLGIGRCRELLSHPLSLPSDARLVSTVEMMSLRAPLHVLLTNSPDQALDQETISKLREANAGFERWLRHWDAVFTETFPQEQQSDFYRESLVAQREYASLFTNSQLLREIRSASDVKRMPNDKRELALRAMENAQNCIRIALRGKSYGRAFKFAVHYTHVCVAFAASFLIRIARLFPSQLDLRQTAKDVEELAVLLSQVPAGRYARSIRLILRRARRRNEIPLPSRATSPSRTNLVPTDRHGPCIPAHAEYDQTPIDNSSDHRIMRVSADEAGFFDPSLDQGSSYQYDFDYAQRLWEQAGLSDSNDLLPL
ncbi:hypothetical protein FFLO_05057 [Filobasidium floriforme]|uniref:Xylanolytic transcriptional activator regulatory domain-containing protein n=1 Tax=Filobasidium floriforme TaxID=5210 RepID=A0A8K0JI16_9TREE|nr:hypothetical protein FFLO_05057 [Filobasidium floriforme]